MTEPRATTSESTIPTSRVRLLALLEGRQGEPIEGHYEECTHEDLQILAGAEADAREVPIRAEVFAAGAWWPLFKVQPMTVVALVGGDAR